MSSIAESLKERVRVLQLLQTDPQLLFDIKKFYSTHPVEFINDWGMTYNPQAKISILPFNLFPKQKEFIEFLYQRYILREDGIAEKCRNVGFTWLAVAFAAWIWLFHPNKKITFGSRKEDLVDRIGDPDSIFEKIRFYLSHLPFIFLPKDFDLIEHARSLKIINPENGAVITGEAGMNMGRGGRSSITMLDEAAHFEHAERVEAALSENSDCKIYISTPNGVGNVFWQKRFSGKFPVFTFNWFDDPRKDQAWFDNKKEKMDSVVFAQEILIDYGASLENVCIPASWVKAAVGFNLDGIDSGLAFSGLDVADGGKDSNAYCYRKGNKVIHVTDWKEQQGDDTAITAKKAYIHGKNDNVSFMFYDNIGVGAGIKGELGNIRREKGELAYEIYGVNTGSNHLPGYYDEESKKKNKDTFINLRAYLWWHMRRRFEKTHAVVNGLANYPVEDLISIPNDTTLITELSQPRYFHRDNGKIQIEAKDEMKKRGVPSPNKADALMLAFTPIEFIKKEPTIRML